MGKKLFNPVKNLSQKAHIKSLNQYEKEYNRSIDNQNKFWEEKAERISWYKKWNTVGSFDYANGKIKWFDGGKLNVSYNCLDRHVESGKGERTALIWEGNNPEENEVFSYNDLLTEVKKFANVLLRLGVQKGDRVCLYMQMVPQLPIAMLACARIGAVHSVVFGAFSSDSLRDRINDSTCKILITQDTGVRGIKENIPMKSNADKAVEETPSTS